MPKARELTEVEKFYIQNNLDKNDSEISNVMKGIGPKTIERYRQSLPENENLEQEDKTEHITESQEERIDRLGNLDAGDFITKRDGVTIMTQEASEITDARKIVQGKQMSKEEFERTNRDKIHRPTS